MAKVLQNLVIHGLSGMIGGQLVVRRGRNGQYFVSAAPTGLSSRAPTPYQQKQRERFREAVAYAKSAQHKPAYEALAKVRGASPFNVAIADFLHPPEIRAIDLSAYTGAAGQPIVILATDDVAVVRVGVFLTADDGTPIEKGEATLSPDDPQRWIYLTTAAAPSALVTVAAEDLAGRVSDAEAHT